MGGGEIGTWVRGVGRGRERVLTEKDMRGEERTGIRGLGRGREHVLTEKDMREERTGIRGSGRGRERVLAEEDVRGGESGIWIRGVGRGRERVLTEEDGVRHRLLLMPPAVRPAEHHRVVPHPSHTRQLYAATHSNGPNTCTV